MSHKPTVTFCLHFFVCFARFTYAVYMLSVVFVSAFSVAAKRTQLGSKHRVTASIASKFRRLFTRIQLNDPSK